MASLTICRRESQFGTSVVLWCVICSSSITRTRTVSLRVKWQSPGHAMERQFDVFIDLNLTPVAGSTPPESHAPDPFLAFAGNPTLSWPLPQNHWYSVWRRAQFQVPNMPPSEKRPCRHTFRADPDDRVPSTCDTTTPQSRSPGYRPSRRCLAPTLIFTPTALPVQQDGGGRPQWNMVVPLDGPFFVLAWRWRETYVFSTRPDLRRSILTALAAASRTRDCLVGWIEPWAFLPTGPSRVAGVGTQRRLNRGATGLK
jgi:hypothetical protein